MLQAFNELIKEHASTLHELLKQAWRRTEFPIPKLLLGRLVWAHPYLMSQRVTEAHVLRWIREGLRRGDVFFDVGAHHGWMSLVAAHKVGQEGKVVAFEPSPPLLDLLSYQKRVNRVRQLDIVPKAVTDVDGDQAQFILIDGGHSSMNSLLMDVDVSRVQSSNKPSIQVNAITLDSFWCQSRLNPIMIKIDVEGAEILVLRGAKSLLNQCHPTLIIAVHPLWLPDGQKADDLFELLRTFGYRIVEAHIVPYKGTDFGDYLCIADSNEEKATEFSTQQLVTGIMTLPSHIEPLIF